MDVLRHSCSTPLQVGIFAGTFNPPTIAHVALAEAALSVVDEVLFVVPKMLPHKQFHGATLEQRMVMLGAIAAENPRFSTAVADNGLFAEIAREAKPHYPDTDIYLVCGRDAAERVLTWEYGDPQYVERMLEEFGMLVAPRSGAYQESNESRHAIRTLSMKPLDECSSSEVRRRISENARWEELIPASVLPYVSEFYLENQS